MRSPGLRFMPIASVLRVRCAKMNGVEVEMEQLKQLVVALMGREEVVCVKCSYTMDDNVGEGDKRYARESSRGPGRKLRGRKDAGRKETGGKATKTRETGAKA